MSGQRTLKRSVAKANGTPLRRGPAKASDGTAKGPARSPTQREVFAIRRAQRAAAEAELLAKQQKAVASDSASIPTAA
jgi:hypothetical protein